MVSAGGALPVLVNVLVGSTIVGSLSLHFSMSSDLDKVSAAELTFPFTWWIVKL